MRRRYAVLLSAIAVAPLLAQGFGGRGRVRMEPNVPYDGRFTFVRLRYDGRSEGWSYDYPAMERHFMKVIKEITTVGPIVEGSNIHYFDDPALARYPVAYLSEPGYWEMNDAEAAGLRNYILKGGFLIVDDFMGREWYNFEEKMLRVLPGARIVPMDISHPIFDSFFHLKTLEMTYPNRPSIQAEFHGIFEDNDPNKRLLVIINYNNDIGDYMEWSNDDLYPVNLTNEAYKFAVNYVTYGLTH
ncbi:MAG TPA: DUF4159 domain-containing protein [Gemmatimonadaceae bacterium]|nr:DUF4159 domain-containing protein [Gemmatimonadaceae bacterium]